MADTDFSAPPMPEDRFFRAAEMAGVVDGDTIDVVIDVGWSMKLHERLRLEFVNTPEKKGAEREAGLWVTEKVKEWLPLGTPLRLASTAYDRTGSARGKFGRTIALVYHEAEGWCLNERLINDKLAWRTTEKGSIIGDRSLALLTGLPAELRGG
ncbi:MAG: hypothetical protein AAFO89_03445 [Planctomycetota bacterium]